MAADPLIDAFAKFLPGRPHGHIWLHMHVLVELGYVATELLHAERGMAKDVILAETAEMQKLATLALLY